MREAPAKRHALVYPARRMGGAYMVRREGVSMVRYNNPMQERQAKLDHSWKEKVAQRPMNMAQLQPPPLQAPLIQYFRPNAPLRRGFSLKG